MKQHYTGGSWYALFTGYGGLKKAIQYQVSCLIALFEIKNE